MRLNERTLTYKISTSVTNCRAVLPDKRKKRRFVTSQEWNELTRPSTSSRGCAFAPSWCTSVRCYRGSQQLVIRPRRMCNVRPLRAQDRDWGWSMDCRHSRKRAVAWISKNSKLWSWIIYVRGFFLFLHIFFFYKFVASEYKKYMLQYKNFHRDLKNLFLTICQEFTHFFLSLLFLKLLSRVFSGSWCYIGF